MMAARLLRPAFRLRRSDPFAPPQKLLILKPCCLSQVMLATPLLAALSEAYPTVRIDWAVGEWTRPAVVGNPRLTELIDIGLDKWRDASWRDIRQVVERLRQEEYDTCFIPSRSSLLSLVAWWAGIPQRIGLHVDGRGFAHTVAVRPLPAARHEAAAYLSLAEAVGVDVAGARRMEFYPPDTARTAVTQRLVEELDWLGDRPLVVMHPGGGENPMRTDMRKRWPVERFARLGNHLARRHQAMVVVVGAEGERPLAVDVNGMMSTPTANLAGQLSLSELGALCEVADLYIGNDSGPTHIAAASGCPTLAIFGPSDPAVSAPYAPDGRVICLWRERVIGETFTWEKGVTVEEAAETADRLLQRQQATPAQVKDDIKRV
jgi:heptosyltransferase II